MNYIHFYPTRREFNIWGIGLSFVFFLSLSLSLSLRQTHTDTQCTSSLFTTHLFTWVVDRHTHTNQTHRHLSLHSSPRGGLVAVPCVFKCICVWLKRPVGVCGSLSIGVCVPVATNLAVSWHSWWVSAGHWRRGVEYALSGIWAGCCCMCVRQYVFVCVSIEGGGQADSQHYPSRWPLKAASPWSSESRKETQPNTPGYPVRECVCVCACVQRALCRALSQYRMSHLLGTRRCVRWCVCSHQHKRVCLCVTECWLGGRCHRSLPD